MGIPPEALTSKIPLGRFGQPEDLAEFVALVASPTGGSATKMQPVPRSDVGFNVAARWPDPPLASAGVKKTLDGTCPQTYVGVEMDASGAELFS